MPNTMMSVAVQTYTELRSRVREAIAQGKERAADAVEREKVRTCWEVGKLINEHVLLNQKPKYGEQVIRRLAADLGMSNTELKYMREFALTYPIGPAPGQLSWAHIREILVINEPEKRKAIVRQAARQNWSSRELRNEIRKLKTAREITLTKKPAERLDPVRGTLNTYQIKTRGDGVTKLDLGFSCYLELTGTSAGKYKAGDLVESVPNGPGNDSLKKTDRTPEDLFTYEARLLKVDDGDTFWMTVDLDFGITTEQQLRLRGLDAPEIATRDGQRAKRFAERELKRASSIIITSSKSDKYDRYLADIFYVVEGEERFLNNRLLEAGLAVVVA